MKWFDRLPEIIFRKSVRSTVVCGVTALLTCSVFANPVINNVAAGNVSIQQTPSTTIIDQSSQKAIINWQSFNIGHNQATHFYQPTGGVALNRISPTQGASQIYGVLTATGQIILINPAGMYFGPSAYVNVGGMIATTENMSNTNFMNGLYQFSNVPGYSGAVVNDGQLITAQNGLIALVAPGVVNNGIIQANLGHVVLASGDAFTVSFSDDDISFAINAQTTSPGIDKNGNSLSAGVTNTGSIYADGGTILLTAQAAAGILNQVIDMQGVAQARSVSDNNGEIILSGDPDAGVVNVAATLDASGKSSGETGGTVDITGYNVLLNPSTLIDVSGDAGGGHIDVGGNTSSLPLSSSTVILPGVTLLANAINSGNGGLIETSGDYLQVNDINVSTTAPNGQIGTWLLDPTNIYIAANQLDATDAGMNDTDDSADTGSGSNPETFAASGSVQDSLLTTANLDTALNSTNVVVTTTNASGTGVGNINVVDPVAWTSTNSLTLNAANNINLLANGSITTGAAGSALILDAGGNVTQTGSGIIAGSGGVTVQSGAVNYTLANTYSGATTLNGGSLTMSGADGSAQDTDFTVNTGTTLTLDDTAAINTAGRIGSASSITLQGGEFIVNGSDVASTNVDEIVGALLLPSNASTVTVNAGSGGSTALTFASITRSAGATVLFRGTNLGANPGAGNTNIFFTNSSGLNLTGGSGAAGSANIDIVPYAIGDTSASGSGIGFVTYDVDTNSNSNGIRPLNTSTEYVLNSLTAGDNIELTTGTTDVTTAASINSLLLNGGTLDFSTNAITETVASGALAYLSGGGITSTTTATRILGFGTAEAIIEAIGSFIIESNISGSGGLTESGAGTLTLGTQVKALTGTYTINSGTLANGIANAIAETNTLLIQAAGTFDLAKYAQTVASLQGNGTLTDSSTPATFTDNEAGTNTFSGNITGKLALAMSGTGTLTLTGNNSYTSATTISASGGTLNANATHAIGTAGITIDSGATLNVNTFDALNNGTGTITVNNGGMLNIAFSNGTLTRTGTISLSGTGISSAGALSFAGSNIILSNDITLTGATTIMGSGSITTLNGTINGADALTLSGFDSITLGGIIGGSTPLSSLDVTGTTTTNSVTTSGTQTYNSSIAPAATTTTLSSTGVDGSIILGNGAAWTTTNTLALIASNTGGTITLDGPITAASGSLNLTATGNITTTAATAINTANFNLIAGQWIQINSTLPVFNVTGNFQLNSGSLPSDTVTFLRALGGDGSSGNPYIITDIYGLQGIDSNATTLAAYYQLGNNISAATTSNWSNSTGTGFVPIGTGSGSDAFSGSFNGNNYIINGLFINQPTTNGVGLFGSVYDSVSTPAIFNVGLTNANITGGDQTGALVGSAVNASIMNSFASGLVTGGTDTGLLAGQVINSNINDSFSAGTVIGTDEAGGLIGDIQSNSTSNSVTNAFSTANVNGTDAVGGLVGTMEGNDSTLTLSNVYGGGTVIGTSNVGGLVGSMIGDTSTNTNTISNAYSTGTVSGTSNLGGLIGQISGASGSSNTVNDTYSSGAGAGLIGTKDASGTINNSFWDTQTSGASTSAGGTGLTTAQMLTPSTFLSAGWNIGTDLTSDTWVTIDGETRPVLAMESTFTDISSAHQLQLIGYNTTTLAGNYTLVNPINASGTSNASDIWNTSTGFIPIGNSSTPFTGTLNGNGNIVYNLTINNTGNDLGLVGDASNTASITDIGVIGTITGGISSQYVGGLVGDNNGTLSSDYSGVNVTGNEFVGDLVGYNSDSATEQNVYSYGNVTGTGSSPNDIGGLIGYNAGDVSYAYSSGLVTGGTGSTDVGGFIGTQSSGTLSNNFFDMDSSGQNNAVGSGSSSGITGATTASLLTLATYAGWNIGTDPATNTWLMFDGETRPMLSWELSTTIADGHALQLMDMTTTGNYILWSDIDLSGTINAADVWGTSSRSGAGFLPIGGALNGGLGEADFLGALNGAYYTINDLYIYRPNETKVGLFGLVADNTIQNVGLTNVNITGGDHMAGLIGYIDYTLSPEIINNAFVTGIITATTNAATSSTIGGLIGYFGGGSTLSNSYADVTVYAPGSNNAGLLTGYSGGEISNSYSMGSITGDKDIGGLVGWAKGGTISNSYNLGSVTGTTAVGGLIGLNGATITDSFSAGMVAGSTNVGGLIGTNTGTVTNSYWNTDTSGQSSSAAGTGLTTSQMMAQANYSGWNFSTVWNIIEGQSYPYLDVFYSITPRVVTGSTSADTGVGIAVNGVSDSTYSGANGVYYLLTGDNLISGINTTLTANTPLLVYFDSGTNIGGQLIYTPAGNGTVSIPSITPGILTIGSGAVETFSNINLALAVGSLTNAYLPYTATDNQINLNNTTLNTATNATYNLNDNIVAANGTTNTGIIFNGPVTANSNVSLIATVVSFLNSLTGNDNITVNGANSNNTLTMQTNSAQIFGITSANAGTVSGMSGYTGTLGFSNIQNLTGGNDGNTFNFSSNATLGGAINGTDLSNTNIININTYAEALKIVLSSTNNGVIQDMANNLVTAFNNITNINTNSSYSNSLYTPSGQASNIYITGGNVGYINDPIYFNGVNTFIGTSGSSVSFLTSATYDPVTNLYYIDGIGMSFASFASYSGYTISSPVISVSNVVQQPPTNATQNASAPVTSSPTWVLAGTSVDQNITTMTTDISDQIDNNLKTVKINPYCYTAE